MRKLIITSVLVLVVAMVLLAGCAKSVMTCTRTLTDGTVVEYKVQIESIGQDFTGSDLSATLDPEGKTTVSAGAIDNSISQVTADVAASMVELVGMMLPYIAPIPPAVP